MRSEKVTVSLPADLVAEARGAVRQGAAPSVSAYIAEAMTARQVRERTLATLEDLYGGPPPPTNSTRPAASCASHHLRPRSRRPERVTRRVIGGRVLDSTALVAFATGRPV